MRSATVHLQPDLLERFERLARQWEEDTRFTSSITEMVLHPAYQQIIGMGPAALPLLLKALRKKPDHWFWALKVISGEDPTPPECAGRVSAMRDAWLSWGRDHGYVRDGD